jgi:NAD(P)-dependent dehydrogenase (short-subunit alcohol dehydrogenase family)
MKGKIVAVTGATSGIGLATVKALCSKGAYVIGTGRSQEKCAQIREDIFKSFPQARTEYLTADFSSLGNVRKLARDIAKTIEAWGRNHLDVLINNAGTFTSWYMSSAEGFEMQFAVNHLAPFLLTNLLFPLLKNAPDARIITVSSGSHYHTRMHWDDLLLRKHYNCLLAYKQSKLANVLFTRELRRRLGGGSKISAIAADPGLVNTEMGLKNTVGIAKLVWSIRKNSGRTPSEAAETIVYLAEDKTVRNSGDIYFKDCRAKKPNPRGLDEENARRLWKISEKMCGIRSEDYGLKDEQ